MRDADSTESTSEAAYNEMRHSEQTLNGGHITLLPGQKQPAVPAIPSGIALPPPPPPADTNPQGATPNRTFTTPLPEGEGSQPLPSTPPSAALPSSTPPSAAPRSSTPPPIPPPP
jgi:hypothetical protein